MMKSLVIPALVLAVALSLKVVVSQEEPLSFVDAHVFFNRRSPTEVSIPAGGSWLMQYGPKVKTGGLVSCIRTCLEDEDDVGTYTMTGYFATGPTATKDAEVSITGTTCDTTLLLKNTASFSLPFFLEQTTTDGFSEAKIRCHAYEPVYCYVKLQELFNNFFNW